MSPESFFRDQVPEEWNRRLAAGRGEPLSFSLVIRIRDGDPKDLHLRVEEGRMRAEPGPASDPLVTLILDRADSRKLAQEVGPSPMALLGGIGGDRDFQLSRARLEALSEVSGSLLLQVVADEPWGVRLHFGPDPVPDAPDTTISIGAAEYRSVLDGELDLQGAFMTGKLTLDGDVENAMKLALALMTTE